MLLNLNSFLRLKFISKSKSKNIEKKKQYYSAGKSVHSINEIQSATTIMRELGFSLQS